MKAILFSMVVISSATVLADPVKTIESADICNSKMAPASSTQIPFDASQMQSAVRTAYSRVNKNSLMQALRYTGVPPKLLKSAPILKGSDDIDVKIIGPGDNAGNRVMIAVAADLNLYTQSGTLVAMVRMTADVSQEKNGDLDSKNVLFRILNAGNRDSAGGFNAYLLEQEVSTAFLNAPRKQLKVDLSSMGVTADLLKHELILAGQDTPEIQITGVNATSTGIVSLETSSVLNIYTYSGTFVARVKMAATLLQLKDQPVSKDVSFEVLSLEK